MLGFSLASLVGAVVALAAVDASVEEWVAVNAGLAAGAAAAFVGATTLSRVRTAPVFDAIGFFTGAFAVIAAIDAWNQSRAHPFLPDALGVTVALLIPLAVVLAWAIFARPDASAARRKMVLVRGSSRTRDHDPAMARSGAPVPKTCPNCGRQLANEDSVSDESLGLQAIS